MLADATTVPHGETIETEVCVVGAGPAGITLAREVADAGIDVVLLERGQASGRPAQAGTALNVGLPYDLERSRSFEVGGAGQRWRINTPLGRGFGRLRELEALDFERRDWVPESGWPFDKEHLDPYYERARRLFDAPWPSADPEPDWDEHMATGPFATGPAIETRVFSFADPSTFPGPQWRSIKNSDRVLALTGAAVTELRRERDHSQISSAEVRTTAAHRFTVTAGIYVLAAGGIENARLLLLSRDRQPEGLGNQHGLVGRYFMEHPHYASGWLVPREARDYADPTHWEIHLHQGIPLQKKYVLAEDVLRTEGLLGCTFRFEARPINDSYFTLRYSERAERGVDAAKTLVHAAMRRRWPERAGDVVPAAIAGVPHAVRHAVNRLRVKVARSRGLRRYVEPQLFWIRAMAEQVPDPRSRVHLIDELDELGAQKVVLDWRLNSQDRASMQRSQELLASSLARRGHRVGTLLEGRELPPALSGGMHHMGTTRMHDSPRRGVVDRAGRVHGVANLMIAGSSVFPTVGYANPTLTLLAMTLRLADSVRASVPRR